MIMYFDGSGYFMKQHENNYAFFGSNDIKNNLNNSIKKDTDKAGKKEIRAKVNK